MPSPTDAHHLFVTGTDTDVGKTIAALLLLKNIQRTGITPFYLKPLQTGCANPLDPGCDAAFIAASVGPEIAIDPALSTLYCLPEPKAPWLAALNAKQSILPDKLLRAINQHRNRSPALVIEGAGGLMVPITKDFLMIDLMADLKIPTVLVARDRLGTINHCLLSIEALLARDIPIQGLLLMASAQLSPPPDMVAENMMAIERFSGIPVAGHIEWIADLANIPHHINMVISKLLEAHATKRQWSTP